MSTDNNPSSPFWEPLKGPSVSLQKNIRYMAGSDQPEPPSYVKGPVETFDGSEFEARIREIKNPAELIVFSASGCPHCPKAVKAAVNLALVNENITTTIVDAQSCPDLSKRFSVKSVPLTILDRGLSWIGVVSESEVATRILSREMDGYADTVFESLLESGRLEDVTELAKTEAGVAQFARAWQKSTTSTRIGLMMVVEEILEEDPSSFDGAVSLFFEATNSDDAALRGDTADLLGQIGLESAIPHLENLLKDPNPDVAEIAVEAIEAIGDRAGA